MSAVSGRDGMAVVRVLSLSLGLVYGGSGCTEEAERGCTVGGVDYPSGSSFPSEDGCNTCFCDNGQVGCTLILCLDGGSSDGGPSDAETTDIPAADGGGSMGRDAHDAAAGDGGPKEDVRADSCPGVGLGTPAEIAATPRADVNLERLALIRSPGVTASQSIYDRVVEDVGRIRGLYPQVAHIDFFPEDDGKGLLLLVDENTFAAMKAGTYDAWDCLHQYYGLETIDFLVGFVQLSLKGIYDTRLIAAEYAELPGVTDALPATYAGDGPTICLGAKEGEDVWHYVFDDASGDCPAGCTMHDYTYFTTTTTGSVTLVATWRSTDSAPVPTWLENCRF